MVLVSVLVRRIRSSEHGSSQDDVLSTLIFEDVDMTDFNGPNGLVLISVVAVCDDAEACWNAEVSRPDLITEL